MNWTADDIRNLSPEQQESMRRQLAGQPCRPLRVNGEAAAKPAAEIVPELVLTPAPDAKKARRNKQLEHAEQRAYFDQINQAIRAGLPDADMIFAVPNGTAAGQAVGRRMVQEGVRRGVPDIVVAAVRYNVYAAKDWPGLFIEMKKVAGVPSDTTTDQQDWHERLRDRGYKVCVCFGWREATAVTADYLGWIDWRNM